MRRSARVITAAWVAALLMWQAVPAAAAAGDLDPAFNGGAPKHFPITGHACGESCSVADVAPSGGRIVVGGTVDDGPAVSKFALARLRTGGALDTTFGGGDGQVVTRATRGDAELSDIAVLPTGKILAAGVNATNSGGRFLIVRYRANGRLDTSFGTNGRTLLSFDTLYAFTPHIALLPNGKFVLAGSVARFKGDGFAVLARFRPDGRLDHAFGFNGRNKAHYPGFDATFAEAVLVDGRGRIVIGGDVGPSGASDYDDVFLARFHPDGDRDRSFSGDGLVRRDLGNDDRIEALVLQGSSILGAGSIGDGGGFFDSLLVRFRDGGGLDRTFGGGDGFVTRPAIDRLHAIAKAPDGKLVGAGYVGDGTQDVAVARFRPSGRMDRTFASGGVEVVDPSGSGEANGVYVMRDGRIGAAGLIYASPNDEFEVVRLLGA